MKIVINYQCYFSTGSLTDRFDHESNYVDVVSALEEALEQLRMHVEKRMVTPSVTFKSISVSIPGWDK